MSGQHHTPVRVLVSAFLFLLLALGIPYWRADYASLELADLTGWPALLVFIVAAATRLAGARFSTALWVVGSAIPAIVVIRIAIDVAADPTSHNLWPLELSIFGFVSFAVTLLGVLAGHAARKLGLIPDSSRVRK